MSEETKKPEKKAELDREKLKNLALNTMIEVAEEELQMDIRKKPGDKQRAKLDRHTIRNLITTIKNTQRME